MNVRCIDPAGCHLTKNKIYAVIPGGFTGFYTIINDHGFSGLYSKKQFRVIKDEAQPVIKVELSRTFRIMVVKDLGNSPAEQLESMVYIDNLEDRINYWRAQGYQYCFVVQDLTVLKNNKMIC